MRASSSPYNREYELAMNQKLMEKSNPQQGIDIWKKQQDTERLEREPEGYHDRAYARDHGGSQLLREVEVWSEDETSEQLRKPRQFERAHQSAEEPKATVRYRLQGPGAEKRAAAEEEDAGHQLREDTLEDMVRVDDETGQGEKRVRETMLRMHDDLEEMEKPAREERWKKLAHEKEEEEERLEVIMRIQGEKGQREALLWEERWKQLARQREAERKSKEFRGHLHNLGYTDEEIDEIIHKKEKDQTKKQKKEQEEEKNKEPEVEKLRPTWIKCHRKHLLPDTLIAYNLPWDWDEDDANYIIIKKWIDEEFQEELFNHTRRLRELEVVARTSSSTPESATVKKDRLYPVRKKSPNGRVRIFQ